MSNRSLTIIKWKLLQWMSKPAYNTPVSDPIWPSFCVSKENKVFWTSDFTSAADKAALDLVRRGWVTADKWGNHRLNMTGMEAASTTPKPEFKRPSLPVLSSRDHQVLAGLEYASRGDRWATSLDCGGSNGSHHSVSLVKLTRHGLAECASRWSSSKVLIGDDMIPEPRLTKRAKGSRMFRITPEGQKFNEALTRTS